MNECVALLPTVWKGFCHVWGVHGRDNTPRTYAQSEHFFSLSERGGQCLPASRARASGSRRGAMRGTSRGSLRHPSNTCLSNFCGSSTFQLCVSSFLWVATATATAVAATATAEEGSGSGIVREAEVTAVAQRRWLRF